MKRIILFIFLLALAGGGFYAYTLFNKKNPDIATQKPNFTLSYISLIDAFTHDSADASRKYIDKIIAVRGRIISIDTSGVISLGRPDDLSAVQCMLDERHKAEGKTVNIGDSLTMKGKCTGASASKMLDINLGTTVEMNFCSIQKN